ncbi:MAG: peptidoglycan-binding protein, partial [Candidatus Kaiserbacteria bacterium]|nr:peptidoglycan-binding protein [Candidatus Kaiserbacteria bacterium]
IMTETYTITPSTTPTVTTGSATSIAQTTVTLGGNITALGTTNVTERGIVYGTTASYGATTSTTSASFSTGAYTENITGLTCGTTYHFSAYALNSIGTDYGADDTFTTSACGAIATITSNSYTVSALGTSNETISNVPYGTSKAVFLSALTSGQSSQTRNSTAVNDPVTTGDVLVVTAEDGTTIVNYTLSVLSLTAEQVVPDGSGFATVNSTTPEVVITNLGSTASVTVSSGTSDATINLGSFIANGTGTIPAIQVTAQNAYNMSIEIPASTVVTSASTTWNGILSAPTVTTITLPTESGITKTLSTAIDVGFVGESLTFSKAVRLLIPNEAGKRVGYSVTSTFTEITDTCASDSQVTGDALSAGAECKIDVGSDLVIWTKHFTTFATYSQTTTSSSGGGGGGGGSSSSRRTTTTATTTSATTTATSTASTNTPEIEQLLNLLAVLKAQLQALLNKTTASSASVSLTRNLELGMEGEDVRALQVYLNTHGFTVAQIGVGSLGNESTHFGPGTKSAVIKFQNAHASTLLTPINLTSGTGYVGEKTRALISGVSSAIAVASKPVAPPVTVPVTPVVVPKTVPTIVQKPVAPVVQKPVVVSPPAVQTLKIGMVSEDVLKLQIFLNNNGFLIAYNGTGSLGNETTSFGIATEAAVMRYQNEFLDELGLTEATGIVDRVTRAHMGF